MGDRKMVYLDGRVVPSKFMAHERRYIKKKTPKMVKYEDKKIEYTVIFESLHGKELKISKI